MFGRLMTNFTWWVNRKDADDRNLFQGGFLGLDNIGIFDRSAPLPGGGTLEQADGTAWMALYCQWMLQIATELVRHDPAYRDMALKFVTHFEWISVAMIRRTPTRCSGTLQDGFYCDVMRMPDGRAIQLKERSLVGLLPMCAATVFEPEVTRALPDVRGADRRVRARASRTRCRRWRTFRARIRQGRRITLARRPGSAAADPLGHARRGRVLGSARDPRDLAPASRAAVIFDWEGEEYNVHYLPAESDTGMFGGNSNWRGPVWFPMNLMHPPRAAAAAPLLRRRAHG